MSTDSGECRVCGHEPVKARDLCSACYEWWRSNGRPDVIPPRLFHRDLEGHMEDYLFLVSTGVTYKAELARRLGVHLATVYRYQKNGAH